jgi:hypothetical protein
MRRGTFRHLAAAILAAGFTAAAAQAGTTADLQKEFSPPLQYADDPLLRPGRVIDPGNVEQYARWLDETVVERLRAGEFTITLGETLEFPIHPAYLQATADHGAGVTLGDEPGVLSGYQAGRPFPGLDPADPDAGTKAAWNMRYAFAPDETETAHFIWRYRDMHRDKVERTLSMYGAILRYKHRHTREPLPELESNTLDLYTALYLRVDSPQDIRNTQLLIHRADVDTEPEQAWMYLNTQRRVKRIGTGQKTDAFLGSDIMIEDFLGYNGRIKDMVWTLRGSDELLLPMYAHSQLDFGGLEPDEDGFRDIPFSGRGGCFPQVTWQLRRVYRLEAVPVDERHPLSKRHYLIDAATFAPVLVRIYDRSGALWKLGISALSHSGYHTPDNRDWQGVITDGVSMIDLQAGHCTTLNLKSRLAENPLLPRTFTSSYLRQMGR